MIGGLRIKIDQILKHAQDYQIKSFIIFLPIDNKNTINDLTDEIEKEIVYLKNKQEMLLKNYKKAQLASNNNNIILNIINQRYSKEIFQNYYKKLIKKEMNQ